MKIAIITDIHYGGPDPGVFDVRAIVDKFVQWARRLEVDLLLDLGDRIDEVDRTTDLANAGELARIFGRFPGKRVHLRGNHDVVNLSAGDHEALFGTPAGHHAIDLGETRLLVWQPSVLLDRAVGFPETQPELGWLSRTLADDARPAIIASHIPVSGASMISNYYFEHNDDFATYPDHAAVRSAIAERGRVAMWLSGHVHWNSIAEVAGIRQPPNNSPRCRTQHAPMGSCKWTSRSLGSRCLARIPSPGSFPLSLLAIVAGRSLAPGCPGLR
jgi:3',5'-cyclic-AMP phosphodiesterase